MMKMELHILKFLYNYFIMHDIKYIFFSINIIKQFKRDKLPKVLHKILIFKIQKDSYP
jgi:hypothetical protein